MKILYILRSEFGLIGTNASYMFPSIVNKTHKVRVLSFSANKNEKGLKVYSDPNVDVRQFPGVAVQKRIPTILKQIEFFNPDVVHQYYHGNCQMVAMMARASETRKRAWFLDIRSPLFGEKEGVKRERKRNLFYQQYYNAIFTHDPASPKTVFPFLYKPIVQAPLAINGKAFEQDLPPAPGGELKCVFAGSIAKRRKLDFLLDGINAIRKRNVAISLDIYGGGNDLDRLKELSSSLGLSNIVKFKGLVPQTTLMEAMKSYHIGICYVPSADFSTAPALKFYEYCAAGIYPICTNNPGLRQAEKQGFETQFFTNTPASFAECVMNLPSKEQISKIRKLNFENAKSFTWDNVVKTALLPTYDKYNSKLKSL